MVAQKSFLDDCSYVVANSLARNLAGVGLDVPVSVNKIGVSKKGQPWISYSVNGKKSSQFVSKKLWDDAKRFLYASYRILFFTESDFGVSFQVCSEARKVYNLTFVITSQQSKVTCECKGFSYRKTCAHSQLAEFLGRQFYKLLVGKKIFVAGVSLVSALVSESVEVSSVSESVPVPVPVPVPASVSASVSESESLASRLWKQRVSSGFLDGEKVRISLCEAESLLAEGDSGYYVSDTDSGRFLVRVSGEIEVKTAQPIELKGDPVPASIVSAHAAIKKAQSEAIARRRAAADKKLSQLPDVFASVVASNIEWLKSSGSCWESSQGVKVDEKNLREAVRLQLLAGDNVFIRTTKHLYGCKIDVDGSVVNVAIR
jgi:hypothetical protein